MNTPSFEIHISGQRIGQDTITSLQSNGFRRNSFVRHVNVVASEWRGTLHLLEADDRLWAKLIEIICADSGFCGIMEEEAVWPNGHAALISDAEGSARRLPDLKLVTVPADKYKACDIHISLKLEDSSESAVAHMESTGIPSVDRRPEDGARRIYTLTCESEEGGRRMFEFLRDHLLDVPGVVGKIVFEITTRHFRVPKDAEVLPMILDADVVTFLADARSSESLSRSQPSLLR